MPHGPSAEAEANDWGVPSAHPMRTGTVMTTTESGSSTSKIPIGAEMALQISSKSLPARTETGVKVVVVVITEPFRSTMLNVNGCV